MLGDALSLSVKIPAASVAGFVATLFSFFSVWWDERQRDRDRDREREREKERQRAKGRELDREGREKERGRERKRERLRSRWCLSNLVFWPNMGGGAKIQETGLGLSTVWKATSACQVTNCRCCHPYYALWCRSAAEAALSLHAQLAFQRHQYKIPSASCTSWESHVTGFFSAGGGGWATVPAGFIKGCTDQLHLMLTFLPCHQVALHHLFTSNVMDWSQYSPVTSITMWIIMHADRDTHPCTEMTAHNRFHRIVEEERCASLWDGKKKKRPIKYMSPSDLWHFLSPVGDI